jgi:hypothetical protein
LNFRIGFFVPDVRMNGASFAPNRMFESRTVCPQLTHWTYIHTYTHTHIQVGFMALPEVKLDDNNL